MSSPMDDALHIMFFHAECSVKNHRFLANPTAHRIQTELRLNVRLLMIRQKFVQFDFMISTNDFTWNMLQQERFPFSNLE